MKAKSKKALIQEILKAKKAASAKGCLTAHCGGGGHCQAM